MPYALSPNTKVKYRLESTPGTLAANDATARFFRINATDGFQGVKQPITPNEIKPNLMTNIPRHGQRSAAGALPCDLSLGTFDPLLEAVTRGAFVAAVTTASFTFGVTKATGIMTRVAGSFVADGIKRGDAFFLNGAGVNASIPFIAGAVSALSITIANPIAIVADASGVASVTLTRGKKAIMPQAGSLVKRAWTFEFEQPDITLSEMFLLCRLSKFSLSMPANDTAQAVFEFMAQDFTARTGGSSPYFTSATTTTTQPFVVADAYLAVGGVPVTDAVDFSLAVDLGITTEQPVGALITPDVFDGQGSITGSITFLRSGSTNLSRFINETTADLQVMVRTAGTTDYICFGLPLIKFGDAKAVRIGQTNAIRETYSLQVGEASASDTDATMLQLCTSAA